MSTTTLAKRGMTDLTAIGFALAGFTSWVMADTCIKLIGNSGLPAYEVVAFLGLSMAMFLSIYAFARGTPTILKPHRLSLQVARASLDMANNVCVVVALRHLTLTLFYILIFTAPMLITLLSAVFLREGLPWRKGAAILVGFAGVVIAVNPFGSQRDADWIGFAATMVCVACFSVNMVWSRVLTRTEQPESLAFFSGAVTAAAGFALTLGISAWSKSGGGPGAASWIGNLAIGLAAGLTPFVLLGLISMGLFCALGTLCFYIAVKHTSAANVSQYHYTQLLTGTFVTYLIWHIRPGTYVLVGGALIFVAGVYIAIMARSQVEVEAPLSEGN